MIDCGSLNRIRRSCRVYWPLFVDKNCASRFSTNITIYKLQSIELIIKVIESFKYDKSDSTL